MKRINLEKIVNKNVGVCFDNQEQLTKFYRVCQGTKWNFPQRFLDHYTPDSLVIFPLDGTFSDRSYLDHNDEDLTAINFIELYEENNEELIEIV